MKIIKSSIIFVLVSVIFVQCKTEDLAPVSAVPNGKVQFNGQEANLFTAKKDITTNVDISPDSSGTYLHDQYDIVLFEQELATDSFVTNAPGTAIVLISLYTPVGVGIASGTYFQPNNKFCQATDADQKLLCTVEVARDFNGDFQIDEGLGEYMLSTEGYLKLTQIEGGMELNFAGASDQDASAITFSYQGEVADL